MGQSIKIVDLFAGPGGLAEGFSAFSPKRSGNGFTIALSVEKEFSAWRTLRLRAFTRQFGGLLPPEYYDYLAGRLGRSPEDGLFNIYPDEAGRACKEAMRFTLGEGNNRKLFRAIREAVNHEDNWVLIGGPPCQAYSLIGRARNRGISNYRAEDDQRHFLYREYLRIVRKFRPAAFVMENVKGILSSRINGGLIFHKILEDFERAGYRIHSLVKPRGEKAAHDPHDFVIHSERYGVPQARHRVILLGVRDDIRREPDVLRPCAPVSVGQVLDDLPELRSGLSRHRFDDSGRKWTDIIHGEAGRFLGNIEDERVVREIVLALGEMREKGPLMSRGSNWLVPASGLYMGMPRKLVDWYRDEKLQGVINHETRGHMDGDLARYLFCACYAKAHAGREGRSSPTLSDFPSCLLPNHRNASSGKFADRFKVQEIDHPAATVTSHISKDGHYYIHYDPVQCRSLTVREAARLQTFPDNYFFEGNRTQQYVQVGNAVPPLLAVQIAEVVSGLLSD